MTKFAMKTPFLSLISLAHAHWLRAKDCQRGSGYTEYVFVALLIFVVLIIGAERIGLIVVDLLSNEELQSGIEQD